MKTEFHEVQGIDTSKMPPRMSPDDVARASLAGLTLGEAVCVPALEDLGSGRPHRRGPARGVSRGAEAHARLALPARLIRPRTSGLGPREGTFAVLSRCSENPAGPREFSDLTRGPRAAARGPRAAELQLGGPQLAAGLALLVPRADVAGGALKRPARVAAVRAGRAGHREGGRGLGPPVSPSRGSASRVKPRTARRTTGSGIGPTIDQAQAPRVAGRVLISAPIPL